MTRLAIPLLEGLKFSNRNMDYEQLLDGSYTNKIGVLSNRRSHSARFSIARVPRRLLLHNGNLYTLSRDGYLYNGNLEIGSGFNASEGTLISLLPTSDATERQLFIAGGAKMQKYNGAALQRWGISTPVDDALIGDVTDTNSLVINLCNSATGWSQANCVVSLDTGIFREGTGSIKVALTANVTGIATLTFSPAVDLSARPNISFYIRTENPKALTSVAMIFYFVVSPGSSATAQRNILGGYIPESPASVGEVLSSTTPQTFSGDSDSGASELVDAHNVRVTQLPTVANTWKKLTVGRSGFTRSDEQGDIADWTTTFQMQLVLLSDVAQNIYIDDIRERYTNQDDAQGARYKYAYENFVTGSHGNLNLTPSKAIKGENNTVTITGFKEPPVGEGISNFRIFRDVGEDGNYKSVGILGVPTPWDPLVQFVDNIGIDDLGDLDTNDNAPPPSATLAVEYRGSVWLNDITNLRRWWRSAPGRYESFSLTKDAGFFDVSIVGDESIGVGIVRGIMFIFTRKAIIEVLAPDATPSFITVAYIGPVAGSAWYVFRDYALIVHLTGLYLFDGADLKHVPDIDSLFDPESTDPRRINATNISTCVVGGDSKHIWFSYLGLDSVYRMFTYAIDLKRWVEESTILIAHETEQQGFYHIAASETMVYDVYGSAAGFESMQLVTPDVELKGISHINHLAIQSLNQLALNVELYVDDSLTSSSLFAVATSRKWQFLPLIDNLGQRARLKITASPYTELYDLEINYTQLIDTVHFDSEFFVLPSERTSVTDFRTHLFGLETGVVKAFVTVDDVVLVLLDIALTRNQISTLRHVLMPTTGTVCRIELYGSRFVPLSLLLGVTVHGTGEQKHIVVPVTSV